jgi:hypothetical protein
VFLPLLAGAAGLALSIVSAGLLDRLREGGFEGLSAPALISGMFGGLLLAGSGAFLAIAPNIRRQRRIDELSERLERLADPARPLMVLAPTPELVSTRDQLVTYYRLLADSPHPDLCDPERLARIQARIDLVERSLRDAAPSPAGPAERP